MVPFRNHPSFKEMHAIATAVARTAVMWDDGGCVLLLAVAM